MPQGANGDPDPAQRATFVAGAANPVDLQIGPGGDLFYVDIVGGTVHRISYSAAPTAVIAASPRSGSAPLTVTFDGRGSSDPDGTTLTYSWDLNGDGTFGDSTASNLVHTYGANGAYNVRLRVTDQSGLSGTAAVTIVVGNRTPTAVIDQPQPTVRWVVGQTDLVCRPRDRSRRRHASGQRAPVGAHHAALRHADKLSRALHPELRWGGERVVRGAGPRDAFVSRAAADRDRRRRADAHGQRPSRPPVLVGRHREVRQPRSSEGWRPGGSVADATAAGGARLEHPDAGAPKLAAPLASPVNYFELTADVQAGRPDPVVAARQGTGRRVGERLGVRPVLGQRRREWVAAIPHRNGAGDRRDRRGLQRLRARGLGLAGQRLWRQRARTADLLRGGRTADDPHPGARGRHLAGPGRAVAFDIPERIPGADEERYDDSS